LDELKIPNWEKTGDGGVGGTLPLRERNFGIFVDKLKRLLHRNFKKEGFTLKGTKENIWIFLVKTEEYHCRKIFEGGGKKGSHKNYILSA